MPLMQVNGYSSTNRYCECDLFWKKGPKKNRSIDREEKGIVKEVIYVTKDFQQISIEGQLKLNKGILLS